MSHHNARREIEIMNDLFNISDIKNEMNRSKKCICSYSALIFRPFHSQNYNNTVYTSAVEYI